MSLFSTITHERFATRADLRYAGLALVLGIVVAIAVVLVSTVEREEATAVITSNWSQERFLEINTTGLEGLALRQADEPHATVEINDTNSAFAKMAAELGVDPGFLYINTISLEYPAAEYVESAFGPR